MNNIKLPHEQCDITRCVVITNNIKLRTENFKLKKQIQDLLQEKAKQENPKPLPYGTLKELNCKPVYIVDHKSPVDGWYIVGSSEWFTDGYADEESREDYYSTWFAYDHEPKEATDGI